MRLGVAPERISALTFTRKAAGEFFDAILAKLARAASDPAAAAELAGDLAAPDFDRGAALTLLRAYIGAIPKLALGTLDSFFADVVRAFPFEFGFAGQFEILDDYAGHLEKQRVLRAVFDGSDAGAGDFLDSFKLATFGREDAGIVRNLEKFIGDLHELFLEAEDPALWGNSLRIWPRGNEWVQLSEPNLDHVLGALTDHLNGRGLEPTVLDRWLRFLGWLRNHQPGAPVPDKEKTLFGHFMRARDDLLRGGGTITVDRRRHELEPEECDYLLALFGHIVAGEIEVRLRRTRGLWAVLSKYEANYREAVRKQGKLTFGDLPLLLAGGGAPLPDQIAYRLDSNFEHWLLDEFQDTSYAQWRVIEPLAEEALQDPEGRRSLFQVGDLKQAIYGWRGGDASLFASLRDRYREMGGGRFREVPLDKSYRSAQPVIDTVNQVFSPDTVSALFPAMRGRWEFTPHSTEHTDLSGCVSWIAAEKISGRGQADARLRARLELAAGLIEEIQPLARGLSVAVLVRRNSTGRTATDLLRARTGQPVVNASEFGIADDNPLTSALRSLFHAAAHPGDNFAWQHLQMTPLANAVGASRSAFCTALLSEVWASGFEATTRRWLDQIPGELDPYSRHRAEEFGRAAALFDRGGSRSVDDFLRYIDRHSARDAATRSAIQVLTVHKAKGLDFDIVILPELEGDALDTPPRGIGVHYSPDREIEWVMQMPNRAIVEADPKLNAFLESQSAEACYESLCLYYVALTRAKRANFLISDALPKNPSSLNFPSLLRHGLLAEGAVGSGLLWQQGDADWWREVPAGR